MYLNWNIEIFILEFETFYCLEIFPLHFKILMFFDNFQNDNFGILSSIWLQHLHAQFNLVSMVKRFEST